MRRTTTPTYIFTFPFNISAIDQMTITFAQGSRKIVKTKADGTIEDTKFSLTLTQEETKYFCDGNCKMQIKLASGRTVLASTIFEAKVRSILDDTVFILPETEDEQTQEVATQAVPISAIEGAEVLIDEIPQEFVVTFTEAVIIGGSGTGNYEELENLPKVNGNTVIGNKTTADLGIDASNVPYDPQFSISLEATTVADAINALDEKNALQDDAIGAKQNSLTNTQMDAVNSGITSGKVQRYDNDHTTVMRIAIELPRDYATRAFVNSSIATNTANFCGTFNSVADLNAYSGTKTNNDYAYVITYDPVEPTEIKQYDRYKYVASSEQWVYEYTLNNSSFTQAQWDAINSGISQGKVQQYDGYANTIANKEDASNKVTIIDSQSTNIQYAGAKAVYDFVDAVVGNINSILTTI